MTDILGHDIDGRPLRAGNEVVVISARHRHYLIGRRCKILGPAPESHPSGGLETDIKGPRYGLCGLPEMFRKLHHDHRPATESFEKMMNNLKSSERTGA